MSELTTRIGGDALPRSPSRTYGGFSPGGGSPPEPPGTDDAEGSDDGGSGSRTTRKPSASRLRLVAIVERQPAKQTTHTQRSFLKPLSNLLVF